MFKHPELGMNFINCKNLFYFLVNIHVPCDTCGSTYTAEANGQCFQIFCSTFVFVLGDKEKVDKF